MQREYSRKLIMKETVILVGLDVLKPKLLILYSSVVLMLQICPPNYAYDFNCIIFQVCKYFVSISAFDISYRSLSNVLSPRECANQLFYLVCRNGVSKYGGISVQSECMLVCIFSEKILVMHVGMDVIFSKFFGY